MNKEKWRTSINILSSVFVMVINLGISFFLSPYIIRTIGIEANGFVALANSFISYANLIVTALNAMAARFITISYIQQEYKKANLYYNSVFWGNLIIVAVLLFPAAMLIVRLEHVINIPADLVGDIKILFALAFLGFFLRTGAPNWDCGTYITNRLDLTYIPTGINAILRAVILVCVFYFLKPRIWFVSIVSLILTCSSLLIARYNTHRLTPELKIHIKHPACSWDAIKKLVGAGIWNAITIAGNMLMSGLDLLLCNIYVSPTMMGLLSLAKTLPGILTQLAESIRGAFGPELTISFAKGDKIQIYNSLRRSMKITTTIVTIPVAGIIVMSDIFYSLWVPSEDAKMLQILTILTMMAYIFSSGIAPLNNVYPTLNKVKYNSAGLIVSGIVSICATFGLVVFTDWDLFAVAGVSSVVIMIRDLCYNVPLSARLLGLKWYTFYPQVGQSLLSCAVIVAIGWAVRLVIPVDSWIMFFLACGIIAVLGLGANMMIVLNNEERKHLKIMLKQKLLRKR